MAKAKTVKVPFTTGNKIWGTYKNYPYKAWYAVAELVDNSTQAYFDNQKEMDAVFKKEETGLEVSIDFDPETRTLEVFDNSVGMDLETLSHAVLLAEPPANTSGRSEFGMGMKTACSWLGTEWGVRTKRRGDPNEYSFSIDIPTHSNSKEQELTITVKPVEKVEEHYTLLTVKGVRRQFGGTAVGTLKRRLAEMYRRDIDAGTMTLMYRGDVLKPTPIKPLETKEIAKDADGKEVEVKRLWRRPIDFEVTLDPETGKKAAVKGYIALIVPGGRKFAGFDLLRRGRLIVGRPLGYRPESIFGEEAPNNVINQRVYGELSLDDFPVNHLKSDFQWDEWQDELDGKLKEIANDYVQFAISYKPTQQGETKSVPPALVQAANDEVAEDLGSDPLATTITILETVGPPPLPSETVKQAEADVLRDQPVEPRIVQLQNKTYTIYHPMDMRPEQAYVRYQAATSDNVDIFLNDNHPYVSSLDLGDGNAERYHEHVRMCVNDAMTGHIMTNLGEGAGGDRFIQIKDALLRK
jgi:hypothetical protein